MLLFEDIAAGKYEVPDWVDPDCADLIKQMLHTNPVERIDLAGIKVHPFVKNVPSKSAASVPIPSIHSMWPHHDRASLSSVIKKLKPQLERQQEQERAARYAFDEEGEDGVDDDHDSHNLDDHTAGGDKHHHAGSRSSHAARHADSRSSSSKCIVM